MGGNDFRKAASKKIKSREIPNLKLNKFLDEVANLLIPADTTNIVGTRGILSIEVRGAAVQGHDPSDGLTTVVLGRGPVEDSRIGHIIGGTVDIGLHKLFLCR